LTLIRDFVGPIVPEMTSEDMEALAFDIEAAQRDFNEALGGSTATTEETTLADAAARVTAAISGNNDSSDLGQPVLPLPPEDEDVPMPPLPPSGITPFAV